MFGVKFGEGSEKKSEKRSEKILVLMKANRLITIAELAESLAIATRNIEKHIAKLKEDHRIERVGADKGGYWEVLDITEELIFPKNSYLLHDASLWSDVRCEG